LGVNNGELVKRTNAAVNAALYKNGYVEAADVLMEMGLLSKEDYEDWRFGRISCLERVCKCNLSKLSKILSEIRAQAKRGDLKASWTDCRKWGKGNRIRLRFSKYGDERVERLYATRYYSEEKMEEAKERAQIASAKKKEEKAEARAKEEEALARKKEVQKAVSPSEI
jgi:hypothetical protein